MSTFDNLNARRPPGTFVVSPNAFADTYSDKPTGPICIGLRSIAERDMTTARSQAIRFAQKAHPASAVGDPKSMGPWIEAYNDALMRWVIARGTCDPNDITQSPSVWAAAPEDQVRLALTTDGVGAIFDAWEKMRIETDPTSNGAGIDECLEALPRLLPHLNHLPSARRSRVARLLRFVISELEAAAATAPPPS